MRTRIPASGTQSVYSARIALVATTLVAGAVQSHAQPPDASRTPRLPERLKRPLPEAPSRQFSLALSPDRKIAATGTEDGSVILWKTDSGQELRTIKAHARMPSPGYTSKAVFSPEGQLLVTTGTSDDKTTITADGATVRSAVTGEIKLWDVATGQLLQTLPDTEKDAQWRSGLSALTFSPDGKTLATVHRYRPIRLWDVKTGKLKNTLQVPFMELHALAFSPDGKTLAGGGYRNEWSNNTSISHSEGEIVLWNTADGTLLRSIKHPRAGLSDQIMALAFSPDGKLLATGGSAGLPEKMSEAVGRFNVQFGDIQLWDVQSGVLLMMLGKKNHRQGVTTLSFSPDGQRLASGSFDNVVALWDVGTGQSLGTVTRYGTTKVEETKVAGEKNEPPIIRRREFKQDIGVQTVAFTPDGKTLQILGRDKSLHSWNVGAAAIESDPVRQVLPTNASARMNDFVFAPNGPLLASVGYDHKVRIWSIESLEERQNWSAHQEAVRKIAAAPPSTESAIRQTGENLLATASNLIKWRKLAETSFTDIPTGFEVKLWNPETGQLLHTLTIPGFGVTALAISPDKQFIAAAGGYVDPLPKSATVQPAEGGGVAFRVEARADGNLPGLDEKVSVQKLKSLVAIWDVRTGELKHKFSVDGDTPSALVFSPDSKTVVSDCGQEGVQLWSVIGGEQIRVLDTDRPPPLKPNETRTRIVIGLPDGIDSIAITPDGKSLIRSRKGKVQIWDIETGQLSRMLFESGHELFPIALSPSGRILASASHVAGLQLRDLASGNLLWESKEVNDVQTLGFSKDSKMLATNFEGGIRLWHIEDVQHGKVQ